MTTTSGRLSALDDSFLAVENPSAHMHVGWAAVFRRPEGGEGPRFNELRDHITSRLPRAPRFRQRIAPVPFGVNAPIWVDDEQFDVKRHVLPSSARSLRELADSCMSTQLRRDRPLWQICIADQLEDGGIGVVGKVHHCMVDGIAAVELGSLLLDPDPEPPPSESDRWRPRHAPSAVQRLIGGVVDLIRDEASLAALPAKVMRSPARIGELVEPVRRARDALAESLRAAEPRDPVNQPITGARHLAWFSRPLDELKRIGRPMGASVNDVLLAVSAGGVRSYMRSHDRDPAPLKTMVPVNVRDGETSELGNRISFVFVDLPCDEPDPVRRLQNVRLGMSERKEAGIPEGGDTAMAAIGYLPRPAQHVISRMIASPKTFNLTVSNIPGPRQQMYMLGCELEAAYPVVPIADEHALSIGMTTIGERACFGLYAASEMLPDSDELAAAMNTSIDELLEQITI
ncbi:MAG TPA: wax ester/triacylglycerol synthase family O-acyltransferase [Solirubrobacterales bacterium]|jgi:WS/DGAT/MGAT family acyltransferase|nr:wax ester/triacylglycerol synthase family O-acyltransferase [Solirubrobacterales bacterium]